MDVFHPLSKSRVEILRQKTIIHHVLRFRAVPTMDAPDGHQLPPEIRPPQDANPQRLQ
jgi:hypothetical protein